MKAKEINIVHYGYGFGMLVFREKEERERERGGIEFILLYHVLIIRLKVRADKKGVTFFF